VVGRKGSGRQWEAVGAVGAVGGSRGSGRQ